MSEQSSTPWHRLETRIVEIVGQHNVLEERVKGHTDDIAEIKALLPQFVTKESFEFYSKAFWILSTAVGSGLVGSIFYVITSR
jgi:hypothetical protein